MPAPDPSRPSRLRELALGLVVAGVSVVATLLLFEVGARWLAPEWAPKQAVRNFWAHDPELGWRQVPNADTVHEHRDFEVAIRTNAQGFRDDPIPPAPAPGQRRVLLLGDSFGFGFGVERDEMMATLLDARHPEVEIVNASVAGYGTDQELLFLRAQGRALHPDVVLLFFHPNDLEDNASGTRYGYFKPFFRLEGGRLVLHGVPVPELGPRFALDRWLEQNTYFLRQVWDWRELVAGWWQARRAASAAHAAPHARTRPARADAPGSGAAEELPDDLRGREEDVALTRALVRALAEETRALGARLVVVSIPGRPDPRPVLRPLLDELGVPYLALDAAFEGRHRASYKFPHDPHWNATGQRIAADAMEPFLEEHGVLTPRRHAG